MKRWQRRAAISLGIAIPVIALASWLFGPIGFAASFVVSLPVAAWYNDNKLGTCLPFAILFLIVLAVLVMVLVLLVVVHPR